MITFGGEDEVLRAEERTSDLVVHAVPGPSEHVSESALFGLKDLPFAVDAPAIAGKGAVAADDPVAGDREGDGVGGTRGGDGAGGQGLAELTREGAVAESLAARDLLEGLPDAELKCGGADVERKALGGGVFGEVGEDKLNGSGEPGLGRVGWGGGGVFEEVGFGEAGPEVGAEAGVSVGEGDGADAGGGGGDQGAAEG